MQIVPSGAFAIVRQDAGQRPRDGVRSPILPTDVTGLFDCNNVDGQSLNFVVPRERPAGPAVMYQNWRHLLFLHWKRVPEEVQATLPPGLEVETWEGAAYVGIIPFFMCGVRPRFCPALPGISNFFELNVRTYVRDRRGRSGVWFYSLDCNQPLAVWAARMFFGLPYFHARMRAQMGPDGFVSYHCRRRGSGITAGYRYRGTGEPRWATAGSLEEFLIERYRLFSRMRGRLVSGQVWHMPYRIAPADVPKWSAVPLQQAGFALPERPPDHAVYSPGVDVSIFPVAG